MEDSDLAVALEDGWRVPDDRPSMIQQDFGFVDDGKVAVGAAERRSGEDRGGDTAFHRHVCVDEKGDLLVVKHQVRFPDVHRWDSDLPDATVIVRVPFEVHIYPLLKSKPALNHKIQQKKTFFLLCLGCLPVSDEHYWSQSG